jgi:1,5-anhydro-D-fructose reductase (1,5-anhydro-D-mannitol-forming)
VVASLHDTFAVEHALSSIEVHGTTGSLIGADVMNEDRAGSLWLERDHRREPLEVGRHEDPYALTVGRFVEATRGRGAPTATGEDGLRSLAVALAARRSAREGRRVEVPLEGNPKLDVTTS